MRRGFIGLALLAALLAGGLLSSRSMGCMYAPMAALLEQSGAAALAGDWEEATAGVRQARVKWHESRRGCAVFTDHTPMEQIDSQFAQLEVYGKLLQAEPFAVLCAALSQSLEAMGDAHSPDWWNLL